MLYQAESNCHGRYMEKITIDSRSMSYHVKMIRPQDYYTMRQNGKPRENSGSRGRVIKMSIKVRKSGWAGFSNKSKFRNRTNNRGSQNEELEEHFERRMAANGFIATA